MMYLTVETLGMHSLRWVVVLMASLMFIASSAREAFGRASEVPTPVDSVQHTVIPADASVVRSTNGPTLHLFYNRGLAGYLDSTGQVHIKPTFAKADYFSEGLAPATINGRYGYINTEGAWYIPAQFDFATPFSEGRATAYIGGHAYIIDLQGKVVHHGVYEDVGLFRHGLAVVYLNRRQSGLVNRDGQLLADPMRHKFYMLDSTRILLNHRTTSSNDSRIRYGQEWSLIDGSGKVIKTMSGYESARVCYGSKNFVFSREQDSGKTFEQVLFNQDGHSVASLRDNSDKVNYSVNSLLPSGYLIMSRSSEKRIGSRLSYAILGPDGKVVWEQGTDYDVDAFGSEFVVIRNRMAGTTAVFKCGDTFQHVFITRSADLGYIGSKRALVITEGGAFSLFTSEGRRSPSFPTLERSSEIYYDSNFIVSKIYSSEGGHQKLRVLQWSNSTEPLYMGDSVSEVLSIRHGVITYLSGSKMVVATLGGRSMYEGPWKNTDVSRRNTYDHRPEARRKGESDSAKTMSDPVMRRKLQDAQENELWQHKHVELVALQGNRYGISDSLSIEVLVINSNDDTVALDATDNLLFLVMEARVDSSSPWVEIEYPPSSSCGNSYYEVDLPPRSLWMFRAKRYQGEIPVECRMKLTGVVDDRRLEEKSSRSSIFSNTFRASVHHGQLWRIQRNPAIDLMDPYWIFRGN